jgi:HAD superfamily hydrolase (TIGR01509 family)
MDTAGLLPGAAPRPRWDEIVVVFLDMDGTLLDQRFDNYFWRELVPERFAALHGMTVAAALEALAKRFVVREATLDWYCIDFWTRELSLRIAELKREVREHIRFLPGAESFLRDLRRRGKRIVLLTNAHPETLAIKAEQTELLRHFDQIVSSHQFGVPKETARFWQTLAATMSFDPVRALFIDDSLAVLRAARQHGIGHLLAIAQPDSTLPVREIGEFPAIVGVAELVEEIE